MKAAFALSFAFALLAGSASAQVHFNELYVDHTSTDDQEFIELIGTPLMSLDYHLVCVVEGEGSGAGTLDRA